MSDMSIYHYYICGLTIQAPFEFEGLPISTLKPDVIIRFGEFGALSTNQITYQGICCAVAPECVLFDLDNIARFKVRDGREIVIDGSRCDDTKSLQVFILGACLGVLLIQRKRLVLHASVMEKNGVTVAFTGAGGTGKSTLASLLLAEDFRVLADNLAVINFDDNCSPQVVPSSPQIHLWKAALERLNDQALDCRKIRPEINKFAQQLDDAQFLPVPKELNTICILNPWNKPEFRLEVVEGPEQILSLVNASFRMKIVKGLGLEQLHFQQVAELAQRVNIVKLHYAHDWNLNRDLVTYIEKELFE